MRTRTATWELVLLGTRSFLNAFKANQFYASTMNLSAWPGIFIDKNKFAGVNLNGLTGTAGGSLPSEIGLLTEIVSFQINVNTLICKISFVAFRAVNCPNLLEN